MSAMCTISLGTAAEPDFMASPRTQDLSLATFRHSSAKTSEIYVQLADADYDSDVLALDKNGIDEHRD